jgi:hypothetical protein
VTPKEAAAVLAKCATYNNRRPDEQAAVSWAQALTLAGIGLEEALVAVIRHHATSAEWCQVAHIQALVGLARRERLALTPDPDLPNDLTGAEHASALAEWRRQASVGGNPSVPAVVDATAGRMLTT